MSERVFAAVDIGASGGRVMAGLVADGQVRLEEVHRFPNGAQERDGHLRWDIAGIYDEVLVGLGRLASRHPELESIGIDTWAVDYGLLDDAGNLLGDPIAYRDGRTREAVHEVHEVVAPDDLYAVNGLQFLPFTTLYQLQAERHEARWSDAARCVLLPDLLAYWLTGVLASEATNASTTGLVDVHRRTWSGALFDLLDLSHDLFPPIERPGTVRGPLRGDVRDALGLATDVVVTTVGSHDTASAVVAVPAGGRPFAYVASGTWSLVGVELDQPVLTSEARTSNFTNEGGVDGRTRFLRNVGGLWLLQECLRTWDEDGLDVDLAALLAGAADLPDDGPRIDVDHPEFIPPGDMPRRIAVVADDPRLATDPVRMTRCIVDSLADAYARTIVDASELSGIEIQVVHVVGGGSQNELLCQLTADRTGLPVTAGPVEATALGNVLVQARAHGAAPQSLEALRRMVSADRSIRTYTPRHPAEATR